LETEGVGRKKTRGVRRLTPREREGSGKAKEKGGGYVFTGGKVPT